MSLDHLPHDSLIDWTSPIVESINRPLIPLPSFSNPAEVTEDNPFDAIERKINENEVNDVFNMNLSFGSTDSDDCKNCSFNDDFVIKMNGEDKKKIEACPTVPSENTVDFNSYINKLSKSKVDDDADAVIDSPLESSNTGSEFSDSELKEIISSRISNCISRALNISSILRPDDVTAFDSLSLASSKRSSILNDAFMSPMNSEQKLEVSKNVEPRKMAAEYEDITSIIPRWDETLSSSDEETEQQNRNKSLPIQGSSCVSKKTPIHLLFKRPSNTREPLVTQDPNVKNKKSMRAISKTGPLKAFIPLSDMKKENEPNKGKVSRDRKSTTLSRTKAISTSTTIKNKIANQPVATSTPQSRRSNVFKNSSKTLRSKSMVSENIQIRPPSPDSTTHSKSLINSYRSPACKPRKSISFRSSASNMVSSSSELSSTRISVGVIRNKENIPSKC